MVLDLRNDDRVAWADLQVPCPVVAHGERHEVERLRGVLRERDFLVVGTHELRDGCAGVLIGVRGFLRDLVGPAVHGREVAQHEFFFRLPHRQRALRSGTGIEIHQRVPAAHGALQDRELLPYRINVEVSHTLYVLIS